MFVGYLYPFKPCTTNTQVQIIKLFAGNAAGS